MFLHHFFLTFALILFNHFFLHYEYEVIFAAVVNAINQHETTMLFYSFIGSFLLVVLSYLFTSFGLFKITYFISKILLRCSQFLLVFMSVINILFWYKLDMYFMWKTGFAGMIILWAIMIGACLSLRAADFNYHLRGPLIPGIMLPLLAEIIVQISSLVFTP